MSSQCDDCMAGKQYASIVGLIENKVGPTGSEWGNMTTNIGDGALYRVFLIWYLRHGLLKYPDAQY